MCVITLTLLGTDSQPRQWRFEQNKTIRVGRAADNDLTLDDHQVSRHHLDLSSSNPGSAQGVWALQSYGTNGTLVNGTLVTQGIVSHGSTIQLGLSGPVLRFEIQAAVVEAMPMQKVPDVSELLPIAEPLQSISLVPAPIQTRLCTHDHNESGNRFCIYCGELLQTLDHIQQYQVVQRLESDGPMDSFLVRPTAIKGASLLVLKRFQPEPVVFTQAQTQFMREVERLKEINHPGVPNLVDAFVEIPYLYVVTEHIVGQTLEAWVQQAGPLAPDAAIATLRSVCDVLTYLHALEPPLLHRDLTPRNILRRRDRKGFALLNFGGLNAVDLGEPGAAQPTVQSDLYQMGIILLFLLTGQSPCTDLNVNAAQHINGATVPPELREIIIKATHPNVQSRYATATELSVALRSIE
jgi:serine/threonine protein kinase, bacterial